MQIIYTPRHLSNFPIYFPYIFVQQIPQWIGLRENLNRKPELFSHYSYGENSGENFPVKTNPLIVHFSYSYQYL